MMAVTQMSQTCVLLIVFHGAWSAWLPATTTTASLSSFADGAHWGYKHMTDEIEPSLWGLLYPQCKGTRQSPIQIDTSNMVRDTTLGPMTFNNYAQPPDYWTVINNGHVVQYSANFAHQPSVSGGGLNDVYTFRQFHFHWGHSDEVGSEHSINNRRFPIELHIVHRRLDDSDASMTGDPIGIAVVGVLFQLAPPNALPNPHFEALTRSLETVLYQDDTRNITLPEVALIDLIPTGTQYYRYLGSLTTPPCAEAVTWTVMATPLNITEDQLVRFRHLHERRRPVVDLNATSRAVDGQDDNFLVDNYRQSQSLGGRVVQYFPGNEPSTTTLAATPSWTPATAAELPAAEPTPASYSTFRPEMVLVVHHNAQPRLFATLHVAAMSFVVLLLVWCD